MKKRSPRTTKRTLWVAHVLEDHLIWGGVDGLTIRFFKPTPEQVKEDAKKGAVFFPYVGRIPVKRKKGPWRHPLRKKLR